MDFPVAVIEKAKRMEQLLQRVSASESLADVCADLGVSVDENRLATLQAKYEAGGRIWKALLDGRFGHERKAHSALRAWLYERKEQDETLRAPQLAREVEEKFGVKLSEGHINYLLEKRGLTAPPGRPYKKPPPGETTPETTPEPTESLGQAGIFSPRSSEARDGPQRDH